MSLTPIISIEILFEDEEILVINKPSGLVVNKAKSVKQKTVQDWMEKKLATDESSKGKSESGQLSSDFYKRGGVVHRLDKDTSGVMVLAKNEKSFVNLQQQFKERRVGKTYLVLVHGQIEPAVSRIKLPIKRSRYDRRRFNIAIKGREAVTLYKRMKTYKRKKDSQKDSEKFAYFSYLEACPKTGRTHQIRVHFKHLGHPLVADAFYLGEKTLAKDRLWCPRLFLHSFKIKFFHPKSQKELSFKAELPKELKSVLEKLLEV